MIQQGQVFRLKAEGPEGEPLWAFRYRVAGRGSARRQVGGFATSAEAQRALQSKLARLGPDGRATTITLAEWVEEYLQTHLANVSRSRSCAGCSPRRPALSARRGLSTSRRK